MPYGWFTTLPDGKTVGVLAGASLVFLPMSDLMQFQLLLKKQRILSAMYQLALLHL